MALSLGRLCLDRLQCRLWPHRATSLLAQQQIPVVSRDSLCFSHWLLVLINCVSDGFLGVSSDSFPLCLFFLHAFYSHIFSIHQLSPEGPSSFLTSSKAFEILNMSLHLILEDPLRSAIVPLGFPGGSEGRESACSAGDPLEKTMTAQSSIFAWRIPWTEEPGWLQSKRLQRVGQDWVTNAFTQFSDCLGWSSLKTKSLCLAGFVHFHNMILLK